MVGRTLLNHGFEVYEGEARLGEARRGDEGVGGVLIFFSLSLLSSCLKGSSGEETRRG